ncbi:MAG: PepSY domain-containing protein, partial [Flavobacteriia bacterium]|nr:PepSY domain-containing protein [Flavobacteriia bacterium]
RPEKGTVKFVFKNHFSEIQLDCSSGDILSVATRRSDILEKIHDGSIIDYFIDQEQSGFKLTYTSLLGLGLLTLSISGFWLWFNPKKIRKLKQ